MINRDIHRTNACFGFPWQSSPHRSLMFNVGVYGTPHGGTEAYDPVDLNREVEGFVSGLGGRKMLYAQTFYTQDEFWKLFDERALARRIEELYPQRGRMLGLAARLDPRGALRNDYLERVGL